MVDHRFPRRTHAQLFHRARRQRPSIELRVLPKRTRSPVGSKATQQGRGAADRGEYREAAGVTMT